MTTRPTSHFIHSGFLDILSLIPENQAHTSQAQSSPRAANRERRAGPEDDLRRILNDDALSPRKENGKDKGKSKAPPTPSKSAVNGRKEKEEKRRSMELGLRKRKVDKGMIGPPMDFRYVIVPLGFITLFMLIADRHVFHASTYEEATELLLRWAIEGVDCKIGGQSRSALLPPSRPPPICDVCILELMTDPSWANPIKDLVKARAKEQQARAVAQVVEATARSRMLGKGNFP